jgi:hypothetical protein
VLTYNDSMLKQRFDIDAIIETGVHTDADAALDHTPRPDERGFRRWFNRKHFHTMPTFAVGARAILTSNLDLRVGAANGATGIIHSFGRVTPADPTSRVHWIKVLLDTGSIVRVARTKRDRTWHNRLRYFKATFPLALAYALTGHKAQGATITGRVLLHITNAFSPGLVYVMLSRVLRRDHIALARPLAAKDVIPIPAAVLARC